MQMKNIQVRLTPVVLALLLAAGCVPAGQPAVYTVEPGDTLAKIAQAQGTTVEELVELNKTSYPSLKTDPGAIEVGWELQVPGKGGGIGEIITINTPSANAGAPTAVPLDRDAFEQEIVRLVNEERAKAGLAPLEVDPGLMRLARERSEDMVARGYFSHYDPVTGADISGDAGENISKQGTRWSGPRIQEIVNGWMESDGHRKNILNSGATRTGVGVAIANNEIVVTQLFK
jgi:uncharacterized protein YkwD